MAPEKELETKDKEKSEPKKAPPPKGPKLSGIAVTGGGIVLTYKSGKERLVRPGTKIVCVPADQKLLDESMDARDVKERILRVRDEDILSVDLAPVKEVEGLPG